MKNIKYKISILILFVFLFSCKKEFPIIKNTYYSDGNIQFIDYFNELEIIQKREVYDIDALLASTISFKNGKKYKTENYDKNGNLKSEIIYLNNNNSIEKTFSNMKMLTGKGKVNENGIPIGWWSYFNKKKLVEKMEFLVKDDRRMLNQYIAFTAEGNVDIKKSYFANISLHNVPHSGIIKGELTYYPVLNPKSKIAICIGKKLKEDFSNEKEVKFDTLILKHKDEFYLKLTNKGKIIFRGFILEEYPANPKDTANTSPVNMMYNKMYFQKEILIN